MYSHGAHFSRGPIVENLAGDRKICRYKCSGAACRIIIRVFAEYLQISDNERKKWIDIAIVTRT